MTLSRSFIQRLQGLLLFLPWLFVSSVLIFIWQFHVPPSGSKDVQAQFNGHGPWLNDLLPAERVTQPGLQPAGFIGQSMLDDPAYGNVRVPGVFDTVRVSFEFRPIDQPLLDIGTRFDGQDTTAFVPVWSEALSHGWGSVVQQGQHFLVRAAVSSTQVDLSDFAHQVAWRTTSTAPLLADEGQIVTKSYVTALKGDQELRVVPVNGHISVRWRLDASTLVAPSLAQASVFDGDTLLRSVGVVVPAQTVQDLSLQADHLRAGVYRVELHVPVELVTREISTDAKRWVFAADTFLTSATTTTLWTNSLTVQAASMDGQKQSILFGSHKLFLQRPSEFFSLICSTAVECQTPQPVHAIGENVRFSGDGFFALDPQTVFFPSPRTFNDETPLDVGGINVVRVDDRSIESLTDGWMRSSFTMNVPANAEHLYFTLSAPHLLLRQGRIDVRSIDLFFVRGRRTWQEWREWLVGWARAVIKDQM